MKKLYLGTEEREEQTFLKNINILLGFVLLLIYDHLHQLKWEKEERIIRLLLFRINN